jgi:ankyrin repeat protein
VKVLLENGADARAVNKNGWPALHYAASKGHDKIVKLLLDNGA